MGRFASLTVLIVIGIVLCQAVKAEAASPVRLVKTLGPRVKVLVNRTSDLLWRNKGTITTGVVLTTFAGNPDPFVAGATTVATATAEKTIETVVPKIGEGMTKTTSPGKRSWFLPVCLLSVIGLAVVFRKHVRRRRAVSAVVFLALLTVVCSGTIARADTLGFMPEAVSTGIITAKWQIVWNLLLIILSLPFGLG